jgi:predicted HTH domain antitoxin
MKKTELILEIPEEILYTLNEDKTGFIRMLKFNTAIELYRSHKLSVGKAAELAEMKIVDFIFELSKHDVPVIDYDADDFRKEISQILA